MVRFVGGNSGKTAADFVIAAANASANVKAGADYVCDGVADEAQINAAVQALDADGGKIELSWGEFAIDSPVLVDRDNVTIVGAGLGTAASATQSGIGTRLATTANLTGQAILVQRAADDRPVHGVVLRDFTVDGGGNQGSGVDGILFRCNRGLIERVGVYEMSGDGIIVRGYASPAWDTYETFLTRLSVGDCSGSGVNFDIDAADAHLTESVVFDNDDNVRIGSSSLLIQNNHLYGAVRYNVLFDSAGSRSNVLGNKIEGAGQHGVVLDATTTGQSDVKIVGNGFADNGRDTDNTYDHLILKRDSGSASITRTLIVGNGFSWKGSGNKPRYGVNLSGSLAQQCEVSGNCFGPASHFGTAAANVASSATGKLAPNYQGLTDGGGAQASVADGGTITHGLARTPTKYGAMATTAGEFASVTAVSSTTLTVAIKKHDGTAGTTQTIVWWAEV